MADDTIVVDDEYLRQIEKARRILRGIFTTIHYAKIFSLAGFLDASDYEITTNTGGVNGSIMSDLDAQEDWPFRQGIQMLERLKIEFPRVSYADLVQLGWVVAVEVTGGPTIEFVPGRKDLLPSTPVQPLFFRPGEDIKIRFNKMGLSDSDLVALVGSLAVLRENREKLLNDDGIWFITQPLKFDNSFFRELLEDEKHGRSRTRTDRYLLVDPYRHYVKQYAEDEDVYFRDYAICHKKISELGFTPSTISSDDEGGHSQVETIRDNNVNSMLARSIVIIAFGYAGGLILLTYFFELRRRVQ